MTINVRGLANAAIQAVNPNIQGVFYVSTGFTVNAVNKQVPSYAPGRTIELQVQALSGDMLKHIDGLNIEGVVRAVRIFGDAQGVVRVTQRGGDLMYFPDIPGNASRIWKVVKVVETWPDWCHVIVNLQTDTAVPV